MMLSIPSTISSTVRVRNASHACGSKNRCTGPLYTKRAADGSLWEAVDFFGLGDFAGQQIVGLQPEIQRQRGRDVDRGIRAGQNADDQRGRKSMQGLAAEDQQ